MKKYALVTGGSRGIGRAVCVKLAQLGYHVIINYVSAQDEAEKTLDLVRATGQTGELLPFDVSNQAEVSTALDTWMAAHPDAYIEVLVNNAGIRRDNLLALMSAADWHRVLDITLSGFYNVTQHLLQPMMFHKYGRIVNMASVTGLKGMPGQSNYAAAKGGLIAAPKALAPEVGRQNLTVNAVAPGLIDTGMVTEEIKAHALPAIPMRRTGTPQEVAALIAFLMKPEAGYITRQVIQVNGGLS